MKRFLLIILLLVSKSLFSQNYSLLEINAKWNAKNNLPQKKICGIRIDFGWLEDQSKEFRKEIKSVPILVLIKDKRPIYQWSAGLDFKLKITEEEFEKVFNKLNK